MPATEQTCRDTKLLHKIFGASSFVMLVATIWMFAADHNREWKPIQRTTDRIEMTMTDWRAIQYSTNEAVRVRTDLEAKLDAARRVAIPEALIKQFQSEVHAAEKTAEYSFVKVDALVGEIASHVGSEEAEASRHALIETLKGIVKSARFREETLLTQRKFKSADRDAAVATHGLAVRDGKPQKELDAAQAKINEILDGSGSQLGLNQLTVAYQKAKEHRTKLDAILKQITQAEDVAQEAVTQNRADLKQLADANAARNVTYLDWIGPMPIPGKKFLELPILDAFNSPRKIDNLWSNGNVIDYNFSKVRRFDRCTTCHQSIQKSLPGSAVAAAYEKAEIVRFQIAVPKTDETASATSAAQPTVAESDTTDSRSPEERELEKLLGLRIAAEGLLDRFDATIQFIVPESLGAKASAESHWTQKKSGAELRKSLLMAGTNGARSAAQPGLMVGDVIVEVNGDPVTAPQKVMTRLLDAVHAGGTLSLAVRRGLPNPYTSHPRLDLFVGSLSPHKMSDFACTICHDGQGSATAFKYASHTPNDVLQRREWVSEHGWFDNTHWIIPMYPARFAEAVCLKCHHAVTDLEPSDRFPDAPAPKVVHGYHLIRKYGCYGCHEINGYDGKRRIGPDLRLEPNVFAAALQLKNDPGFEKFSADEKDWTNQLVDHPDRDQIRYRLLESLEADAKSDQPKLTKWSLDKLTPLFRDIESPGVLRKAGPSLRFAGAKMDGSFLFDWISQPKHFRESTRMPQFFNLTKHLEGSPGLEDALAFEPIELLGLVTFLRNRTQKFDYLEPAPGVTEAPNAARGKVAFQTRGCLACHSHKEFSDTAAYRGQDEIVQGPDLSGIGDKLASENGKKWLYSWIKQPTRYHTRTVMPDLFLDPIVGKDEATKGKVTDPAADIVAFLLDSKIGWKPADGTLANPADANREQLDRFVKLNLEEAFAKHRVEEYATKGIPESLRGELKGAEMELVVAKVQQDDPAFQLSAEQKLLYVGSKTISKYGCYACHDIPGFEDAKPIGTVLADWGRKDSAKLAFEHITHYIEHGHGHVEGHSDAPVAASAHGDESDADAEYYLESLKSGHRAGFLFQKLKEPRSYDFQKTENKKYSERLRMPQFPFSTHDREAVVTFILGLVADPPTEKYIYKPTTRAETLLAGREVLEKYNCGGCHILGAEKWQVAFEHGQPEAQGAVKTFPFVSAHFSTDVLTNSAKPDRSGLVRAMLQGMPAVDDTALPMVNDDQGDALEPDAHYDPNKLDLSFDLWKPTAIDGHPNQVGVLPVNVRSSRIERRYGSEGGFLAKYLLSHVVALEKQANPAAKGSEAWGWLPPPLIGEGSKVQTDWLHSFLLNPYPIRPATFLRMPRFNMSPAEATKLVNYFAAVDNADFPYAYSSRRQTSHLAQAEAAYQSAHKNAQFEGKTRGRLEDAMRAVVNNNYCVKCHLVGDFEPTGSDRAKAPNLALVHRRLRPEFVRNWIANPKSVLPYTSMPVNIPYDPDLPNLGGIAQDLFHGTSVDQVDGLVDLLMNYDEFAKQRSSVADLVKKYGGVVAPTTPAAAPTAAATGGQ